MKNVRTTISPPTFTNFNNVFEKIMRMKWSPEYPALRSQLQTVTTDEEYQERFTNIAQKFGFTTPDDLESLEIYLSTGIYFVSRSVGEKKYHDTRTWESALLFDYLGYLLNTTNKMM